MRRLFHMKGCGIGKGIGSTYGRCQRMFANMKLAHNAKRRKTSQEHNWYLYPGLELLGHGRIEYT